MCRGYKSDISRQSTVKLHSKGMGDMRQFQARADMKEIIFLLAILPSGLSSGKTSENICYENDFEVNGIRSADILLVSPFYYSRSWRN